MRAIRYTLAAVMLAVALVSVVALDADAIPENPEVQQPYGGCKESWPFNVDTPGADDCRALGWIITNRVLLDPNHVLRGTTLPTCKYEDGSGQRGRKCIWNGGKQGNHRGATYIMRGHGKHRSALYVWAPGTRAHLKGGWHFPTKADLAAHKMHRWEIIRHPGGHGEQRRYCLFAPDYGWQVTQR